MGDIADMCVNGDMCELCGLYLGEGSGYPRKCKDCTKELQNENHKSKSRKNKKH